MRARAAAVGLAMVWPSLMAWLYFVVVASPVAPGQGKNPLAVALFAAGKVVQFSFPIAWVWLVERRRPRLAGPGRRGLAWGLGSGFLVAAGIVALYWLVLRGATWLPWEATAIRVHAKMAEFGLLTPAAFVAFGVFLSGVHSLLEEYYWRWFVFGQLRTMVRPASAIAVSSLAFAAHHLIDLAVFFPGWFWQLAVPLTACVAVGGAFWAWLYRQSGSLYGPWLSHALVDAAIMTVGYGLMFGGRVGG